MIGRDTAPEPSMEEILASIRKIIADEPATPTPTLPLPITPSISAAAPNVTRGGYASGGNSATHSGATDAAPSFRAAPSVATSQGLPSSLSARLNDVFGTGSLGTEGRPLPSRAMTARSAVDDDLGDLLADNPQPVAPPKPVVQQQVIVQETPLTPTVLASWPAERPAPTVLAAWPAATTTPTVLAAPPAAQGAAPVPPQSAPSTPAGVARPEPVLLAAMPVATQQTLAVPTRHTGSAIPAPTRDAPTAMFTPTPFSHGIAPVNTTAHDAMKPSSLAGNPLEPASSATRLLPAARPLPFIPQPTAPADLSAEPPLAPKALFPVTEVVKPTIEPTPQTVLAGDPTIIAPMPTPAVSEATSPGAEPFKAEALMPPTALTGDDQPLASVTKSEPVAKVASTERTSSSLPELGLGDASVPDPSADAVASALGALAAGLAASARGSAPEIVVATVDVPPVEVQPALPPESTVFDVAPSHSVSVLASGETFVAGVALTPMASSQALEDQAAELLRPMLRQWLDANMPRIVEKALRIEFAGETAPSADKAKT
jgi:cell pole-organizing protein PopZ